MKLTCDSHFVIGHAHHTGGKPCQDYALSGVMNDHAFAIVSDGCSTGGLTDVGSRIIALSTARAIKRCLELSVPLEPNHISLLRSDGISQAGLMLGLTQHDLLATCIYCCQCGNDGYVQVEGDGVIALKYYNGTLILVRYDWADNTPYYPAYGKLFQPFIAAHGDNLKGERLKRQIWMKKNGKYDLHNESVYTLEDGMLGSKFLIYETMWSDLEFIGVFTDGVCQVENMDWKDAAETLMAFKTSEGEFAKRRLNRMVRDATKNGRGPIDDLSFSVIKIDREKQNGGENGKS